MWITSFCQMNDVFAVDNEPIVHHILRHVHTSDGKEVMKMSRRNQHVVPHANGWAVQGAGNSRATAVHPAQAQATAHARSIAQNQQSELLIHGRNGQIRERDSYGNDPYPPKG